MLLWSSSRSTEHLLWLKEMQGHILHLMQGHILHLRVSGPLPRVEPASGVA
jgi:hypothetical protein